MPKPQGIISAQEAQTLNDNWTNLRAKANEAAAGQPDNRSSWYSLDDMQNFLDYIKEKNDNVNGVRFYLGVETTKEDPKGMTTIFMVPTEEKDGKNIDIEGAEVMDRGLRGDPPPANYPQ
ncbi:hypothetical protein [Mesoflavibacter sp. SCSIO 43206]|uniref:hypothetical protein n=1 Tax=Mesoflavibacter sp. SCSIO 43206 TaxID=2779362 RepID=UPI001CA8D072|nr:hypothetical protein [Mesoflavibacter sp. SCSIO 43206]UAB75316.1 hypothetical protein INR78_13125 [Mesoflavibacter sp. SCSIO 43206]